MKAPCFKQIGLTLLSISLLSLPSLAQRGYYPPPTTAVAEDRYNAWKSKLDEVYKHPAFSSGDLYQMATCYGYMGDHEKAYIYLDSALAVDERNICQYLHFQSEHYHGQPWIKWQPERYQKDLLRCSQILDSQKPLTRERIEKATAEAIPNKALALQLWEILQNDQRYRLDIERASVEGLEDKETELWIKQNALDRANVKRIENILATYGYPGADLVGKELDYVAWLVLFHAPAVVMSSHIEVLIQACANQDISSYQLLPMIDRMYAYEHRVQIFGTQLGRDESGRAQEIPLASDERIVEWIERLQGQGIVIPESYIPSRFQ